MFAAKSALRFFLGLYCTSLLLGGAASAGNPALQDADAPEVLMSAASEDLAKPRLYTEALAMGSFNLQVARWGDPVCVSV